MCSLLNRSSQVFVLVFTWCYLALLTGDLLFSHLQVLWWHHLLFIAPHCLTFLLKQRIMVSMQSHQLCDIIMVLSKVGRQVRCRAIHSPTTPHSFPVWSGWTFHSFSLDIDCHPVLVSSPHLSPWPRFLILRHIFSWPLLLPPPVPTSWKHRERQ